MAGRALRRARARPEDHQARGHGPGELRPCPLKPCLYAHLGDALATDYFRVREQFTTEQWEHFIATRRFVDDEVLPVINGYWEAAELPWPLMSRLADLGLYGEDIEGYGCPGISPLARGLVNMELHRGDGSLGTFLGVQSGLAMKSIALLGSDEQKEYGGCRRWHGWTRSGRSRSPSPRTARTPSRSRPQARRDGDGWVLDGAKRWIGNGSIADVVVVWARDADDGQVKGFLVETVRSRLQRGDDARQGRVTRDLAGPDHARLLARRRVASRHALVQGRRPGPDHDPQHLRLGRARPRRRRRRRRADLQQAAPSSSASRCAPFQIVQDRLVKMLAEVTGMQLYCMQLARLEEAGQMTDTIAGLAKLNNTRKARAVIAKARDLLGGNGVSSRTT